LNLKKYLTGNDKFEMLMIMGSATEIGYYADDTKKHAKTEQERRWAKWLKTAETFMNKVIDERLMTLDPMELKDMVYRREVSDIRVVPHDAKRVVKAMAGREYASVPRDDLLLICELAMIGCHNCPQGEYVKRCEYRAALHACGVPIDPSESCGKGRCEFRSEEGIHIILPQGGDKLVEHLKKQLVEVCANDDHDCPGGTRNYI